MRFDGTDLAAALIHELKNELGLLALAIERIPRNDPAVDEARLLCQRVAGRLRQALMVYKSTREPVHPAIDAWPPADVADNIAAQARALSNGRLAVETELADGLPDLWFFDRDLVEMALVNAVHNAITHARTRITVGVGLEDGCLVFTVRDDSVGYPDAVLNGHVVGKPTGTGLGLQFARLIAQSHDNQGRRGELRLANDGGAVFSLLLP